MNAKSDPLRLTPTQRLHEVTLAALTRTSRPPVETVDISRNAKGDAQFTVNAATLDGETLKETSDRAQIEFDRLCAKYPTPEGTSRRVAS